MSHKAVSKLHPERVTYRDHSITLRYRPKTNDWSYKFVHTTTMTINNHAPRYETAVAAAKKDIDNLVGNNSA